MIAKFGAGFGARWKKIGACGNSFEPSAGRKERLLLQLGISIMEIKLSLHVHMWAVRRTAPFTWSHIGSVFVQGIARDWKMRA